MVGKEKFPHSEISPGNIAKFQLCSLLATESYTTVPLGFWTGEEKSGRRKSLHEGIFHLAGGDHSGVPGACLPDVYVEASVSLHCELHVQAFIS